MYQGVILVNIQIIGIVVFQHNGFIAVTMIYIRLLICGTVKTIKFSILWIVVIEILIKGTAGKEIGIIYLFAVLSINSDFIKCRCGFGIIMQVINIVTNQGCIDAWIRV